MNAPAFTKEMRRTHTVLIPALLTHHFTMLPAAFAHAGCRAEVLTAGGRAVEALGLRYVHNDMCYPAIVDTGQILEALTSGRYDPARVAVLVPQTGGGCRVGNYYDIICLALRRAGFSAVPVITLDPADWRGEAGFPLGPALIRAGLAVFCYGDLLMTLYHQTRPYECEPGAARALLTQWEARLSAEIASGRGLGRGLMRKNYARILESFAALRLCRTRKCRRVGVGGEVYTKFCSQANRDLEEFLFAHGCEPRFGGFTSYALYLAEGVLMKLRREYPALAAAGGRVAAWLEACQRDLVRAMRDYPQFTPLDAFAELRPCAEGLVGCGFHMGDGWLVAAELARMIEQGYRTVLSVHPFACLVSHISCRGVLRPLRKRYPEAHVYALELDSGVSDAIRLSRLLLALSGEAARE